MVTSIRNSFFAVYLMLDNGFIRFCLPFLKGNDVLKRYLKDSLTGSGRKRLISREFGQVQQVQVEDNVLNEGCFMLIEDIIGYPYDGVKKRYKRIGLSVGTGNSIKQELLETGLIESQIVKVGKSHKLLLGLSTKGKKVLGIESKGTERASLVHEYWKHWYASQLARQGYRVLLEVPRKSGRVDVVARKGAKQIAIEIETGKSDIVWNVKQDLLSGYDKVLVIATDGEAMKIVEEKLARYGLIIPKRVEILLKDQSTYECL